MSIGIYKITNKVNGKIYIGQSSNIERRFNEHKRRDEQQIDEAIKKYGVDSFDFDILEECSVEDLNDREEFWTLYYNSVIPNGYNIGIVKSLSYGENNPGSILTNEDIKIIRTAYQNKTFPSAAELARQLYPEFSAAHISEIFYGKKWTHLYMEVYTEELEKYYKDIANTSGGRKPGELNPAAILSEEDVICMRAIYTSKQRSYVFEVFPEYKERTIISILMGQNWKHLPIYKKREKIWLFPKEWKEKDKLAFLDKVNLIKKEYKV